MGRRMTGSRAGPLAGGGTGFQVYGPMTGPRQGRSSVVGQRMERDRAIAGADVDMVQGKQAFLTADKRG